MYDYLFRVYLLDSNSVVSHEQSLQQPSVYVPHMFYDLAKVKSYYITSEGVYVDTKYLTMITCEVYDPNKDYYVPWNEFQTETKEGV